MSGPYGADPELCIVDAAGQPVPAHRFFPPKAKRLETNYGSIYRDGFMLELNPSPSHCRALLGWSVRSLLNEAKRKVGDGYRLAPLPATRINLTDLLDSPDDVRQFGCEPAMNAYTGTWHHPNLDETHTWRYAGGHLHYSGYGIEAIVGNPELANLYGKMCDQFIGLPLAVMFPDPAQFQRRKYYGLAGEYRIQTYQTKRVKCYNNRTGEPIFDDFELRGFEYRTPGPEVWNGIEPAGLALGVMACLGRHFNELRTTWDPSLEPAIQSAINTGYPDPKTLLRAVPNFYSPGLIVKCAGVFDTKTLLGTTNDLHDGWGEFAAHMGQ